MDNEARYNRTVTLIKWGVGLGLAGVASIVVFSIIKGVIGLAIAAALGYTIIHLAPRFADKVANWNMRLLIAEAEANPIPTMHNLNVEKTQRLNEAARAIEQFGTVVLNYDDKKDDFKARYPEKAVKYEELSQRMHDRLNVMKQRQRQAITALDQFREKIEEAEAIFAMSEAAAQVKKLSRMAEGQVYAQIKEQVAFDAVRSSLNSTFAGLDSALEDQASDLAALPPKTDTIDVSPEGFEHKIKEPAHIERGYRSRLSTKQDRRS